MASKKSKAKRSKRKKQNPAEGSEVSVQNFLSFAKEHPFEIIVLIALAFLMYGSTYSFGYVLDDRMVFSENNFVLKGFAGIREIFANDSFVGFLGSQQDLVVGARYRPLSIASFAIEQELYGARPGISHLINVFLYAVTTLVLFRLVHYFPHNSTGARWGIAFGVALIFLVHPVHSEVVANIKGRDEIMTLLFSLLSLISAIRYGRTKETKSLLFTAIWYVLALFSKENAIMFLFIIPLTLYFLNLWDRKQVIRLSLSLIACVVFFLAVRTSVIGYLMSSGKEITGIMNNPFYGLTFSEKYGTILYSLGYYLRLFVAPWPLTHDYYPYQIPIVPLSNVKALVSLAAYGGLGYLFLKSWKDKKIGGWGIAFFAITLALVSNVFFPTGAPLNERFLFLPSVGLIVASLWAFPTYNKSLSIGVIGVSVIFAALTVQRVPAWESALSLNEAAIKVSTNSARANSYYGYSLYIAGLETEDPVRKDSLFQRARPYVEKALEIYPNYTDALTAKAGLLTQEYKNDQDLNKLFNSFYEIQYLGPISYVDTYLDYLEKRINAEVMASFYHRLGFELFFKTKRDPQRALSYIQKGLRLDPGNAVLLQDQQQIKTMNQGIQLK